MSLVFKSMSPSFSFSSLDIFATSSPSSTMVLWNKPSPTFTQDFQGPSRVSGPPISFVQTTSRKLQGFSGSLYIVSLHLRSPDSLSQNSVPAPNPLPCQPQHLHNSKWPQVSIVLEPIAGHGWPIHTCRMAKNRNTANDCLRLFNVKKYKTVSRNAVRYKCFLVWAQHLPYYILPFAWRFTKISKKNASFLVYRVPKYTIATQKTC